MTDTSILVDQGWKEESPGCWLPPSSYRCFPVEQALRIARHADFKLILSLLEGIIDER